MKRDNKGCMRKDLTQRLPDLLLPEKEQHSRYMRYSLPSSFLFSCEYLIFLPPFFSQVHSLFIPRNPPETPATVSVTCTKALYLTFPFSEAVVASAQAGCPLVRCWYSIDPGYTYGACLSSSLPQSGAGVRLCGQGERDCWQCHPNVRGMNYHLAHKPGGDSTGAATK